MKYRKKPVVIEAFQMTPDRRMDNSEWPAWLHEAWNGNTDEPGTLQRANRGDPLPDLLEIITLEGKHLVSWGDYIIRGVKGEFYPCKPDIFAATYEPVEAAEAEVARLREVLLDPQGPNLGAKTREPGLMTILTAHYQRDTTSADAADLAARYLDALKGGA